MSSPQQQEALRLIEAGRVTYGDPAPARTRRAVERGTDPRVAFLPEFLIDGYEAYGGQRRTLRALARAGRITCDCEEDGTPLPVTLTSVTSLAEHAEKVAGGLRVLGYASARAAGTRVTLHPGDAERLADHEQQRLAATPPIDWTAGSRS